MDSVDFLGSVAGALTTIAFVPQVLKTWRSRSAADISSGMFMIFSTGVILWLIYGIAIDAWPIIIANTITLILTGIILGMKIYFHR